MKYSYIYLFVFLIFITVSGCTTGVVVGGAAAAGVVAVTHDSVTTSIDVEFTHAWRTANDQLKKLGTVDESHQKLGEIKAKVENNDVTVRISRLTEKTVDIKVAARNNIVPNIELARAILANIIRNL